MDKLEQRNIVSEVKKSFLEYSMSVIVARALPDLRDGLKPVHRRILYAMYEDGLTPNKPFRKSATTVGNVLGRYHPHGDSSVYDAMVRMAQDFSYRYPLVDGHGNFGSIDGDGAAAYRYTEARLSKISLELLRDIDKNTVDFIPNFDGVLKEPVILPSRVPNILVNGTMGIAVGMATNIPPHNLSEIVDGCVAYIDNPDIDTLGLMQYIKGPDFPTGATILGNDGIKKAYDTGRGIITIRSKIDVVDKGSHFELIITELPYQVNKTVLQQRIGELVRDKIIDGIADLRDETNLTNGIKVVIVLKKDANANVVLNNLYKHTQLQVTYGIILLMLDQGQPKTLGLKDILSRYIDYQREVIIRRTRFDLEKAQDRVHILEGLKIALDNIDEVIKIIRGAKADSDAKEGLISRFGLTEIQADAILEMKLRRLTGLEKGKIEDELKELLERIDYLNKILASDELVLQIIKDEMLEIKSRYGDDRKTQIDMTAIDYIEDESLIPNDKVVIALTNKGYIKRTLTDTYKTQNRGGVGVKGMTTNDEDFVEKIIGANTHDHILFFTNYGKVYRIKGYEIPEFSRQSKGLPIINLLPLEKNENISSILTVNKDDVDKKYFVFVTRKGLIKKTSINEYDSIRTNGKIAVLLKDDDELVSVEKTSGEEELMICSDAGRMVRFDETEIRSSGRNSAGVRGISLDGNAKVVGFEVVNKNNYILIITEKGYGKKTLVDEYRLTHRGSKGVKALNITNRNGKIVAFENVIGEEELIIVTNLGILIRILVENISILKRNTQGVRLMNLKEEQSVSSIAIVEKSDDDTNLNNSDADVIE